MVHKIKNFSELNKNKAREDILTIGEASLEAIDTEKIIKDSISIKNQTLFIKDESFDLTKFKNIKVIGFGKASCEASLALEKVIGARITQGISLGVSTAASEYIQTYEGTHPLPSAINTKISHDILIMSQEATADDLVLVVVSGGGSALLCWPETEREQSKTLYETFLKTGGSINELNIIRKHLSLLKGGGLAKALYPATVVGLIFSDIPGGHYDMIASGPTFKDTSTRENAVKLINKYNLGHFDLLETPKEDKFFEKVHNIALVSNDTALSAMKTTAEKLGYEAKILTDQNYDDAKTIISKMQLALKRPGVILVGGEQSLVVVKTGGKGGRCSYATLQALLQLGSKETFLFLASDGLDNGPSAGGIADEYTKNQALKLKLDIKDYLDRFDGFTFLEKTGDFLMTSKTNANVSDLMVLLKE